MNAYCFFNLSRMSWYFLGTDACIKIRNTARIILIKYVCFQCEEHEEDKVSGDLCIPLCGSTIHSISCQSFHAGKEIVFSAVHLDKSKMVFKMARQDDTSWLNDLDTKNYPTEAEFEKMIQNHISLR